MGSFLDKPSTEKTTEAVADDSLGISAGAAAMQGWRITMEDAHTLQIGVPGHPDYCWFAVFDGHGGSLTSSHASKAVLSKVVATPEWQADSVSPESIGRAIVRGFLDIDEDLRKLPSVMTGDDRSGSTAIAALVTPRHLIVANCGDSRCILVRRGDVVEMSDDHKPYNEGEQRRIVAAGGTVTMRRVNGDLAVSRALGDFVYKHTPTLPPESQQVSAEPEIRVVERSPGLDQYLLLACDGVWDVMTNEEAGGWILSQAAGSSHSFTPTDLAAGLIDECLQRGSRDNMSAVVVAFKQGIQAQKTAAPAAPTAAAVNGASGPSSSSAAATAAGGSDDVEMASSSSSSSAAAQVASSSSATHSSASGGGSSSGPAEAHAAPASSAAAAGSSSSSSSSSAAAAGGGDPEAQSLRGVHESSNSSSSSSGATSDRPGDLASSSAST